MPRTEQEKILQRLSTEALLGLRWQWWFYARPAQLPPPDDEDWVYFMMMAGRGSGKTRAGSEFVRACKDRVSPIALVGATKDDAREIMLEGPAGIFATSPPNDYPSFSRDQLTWPNGAVAQIFGAERPDRLRGPQFAAAWCDELASWKYPDETWSNLEFGLRLGPSPRAMITTTPRPIKLVRQLLDDPMCRVSRTSSYANRAHLAERFFSRIIQRHEGTRLGRQEIYGELLEDVEGALWTHEVIERGRIPFGDSLPDFGRIIVAIDPAATSGEDADETGILVCARDLHGHAYVLADHSDHYQPIEWARTAVAAFHHPQRHADLIVAEINNGGEMVEQTIRMVDPGVPYKAVRATRGKVLRAEPVSALYEQGRVHHVGMFAPLEDQMTNFTIDYDRSINGSPDRVDALVWAITELLVEESSHDYWTAWARW